MALTELKSTVAQQKIATQYERGSTLGLPSYISPNQTGWPYEPVWDWRSIGTEFGVPPPPPPPTGSIGVSIAIEWDKCEFDNRALVYLCTCTRREIRWCKFAYMAGRGLFLSNLVTSWLFMPPPPPLWKASGDIEKQQRMANGPANRGSLFNVRRSVLHSLRRFLFICSNVLYARFAIQCSPRRSPCHLLRRSLFAAPFPVHFPQFSLFKLRYSMFAAPLAIRSSPSHWLFAAPFAVAFQCPLTLSIPPPHL